MGTGGWSSRGYLPHFDSPEKIQLITFHLFDSLPKHALQEISAKLESLPEGERKAEKQRRLQRWLDSGYGECYLREPDIAQVVQDLLLVKDGVDYRLLEWCIMPNHVHVLLEILPHADLYKVVKNRKGASSTLCNRVLARSGPFWFWEYHDRFMRDSTHFANSVGYVRDNPVKAGLCATAEDWTFGSAYYRATS